MEGKGWEEMQSVGLDMFACVIKIEMMSATQGKYAPIIRVKLKSAWGAIPVLLLLLPPPPALFSLLPSLTYSFNITEPLLLFLFCCCYIQWWFLVCAIWLIDQADKARREGWVYIFVLQISLQSCARFAIVFYLTHSDSVHFLSLNGLTDQGSGWGDITCFFLSQTVARKVSWIKTNSEREEGRTKFVIIFNIYSG